MRIRLVVLALVCLVGAALVYAEGPAEKRRCDVAADHCTMCSLIKGGLPPAELKDCNEVCDLARRCGRKVGTDL